METALVTNIDDNSSSASDLRYEDPMIQQYQSMRISRRTLHETQPFTQRKEWQPYSLFPGAHPSSKKECELGWWLGKVIEIHDDYFVASVEDKNGKKGISEFEKNVVSQNEMHNLVLGAIFTYSISFIDQPTGRRYNSRFSLSAQRKWLESYKGEAEKLAEAVFPKRLLDL